MPADQQQPGEKQFPLSKFKGLNERAKFINPSPQEFDNLQGFIQQRSGAIQRPTGIMPLQYIPGSRILSIGQTFDTRQNVLVQTDNGVLIMSEDEMMNRPVVTNLIPIPITEEEDMARALLYHTQLTNVGGGALAAATWTTTPLNQLIEQVNPDGSLAGFVTATPSAPLHQFTLAPGTYRFKGKCVQSNGGGNAIGKCRLFNVTTALPAWNLALNEEGTTGNGPSGRNMVMFFEGTLILAVPTTFRIEQWSTAGTGATGFGAPANNGKAEVYTQLEILKTA